jgi:hypothetical protein
MTLDMFEPGLAGQMHRPDDVDCGLIGAPL